MNTATVYALFEECGLCSRFMSRCLCVMVRNPAVGIVLFEQEVGLLVLTSVMQRPLTPVSKGALFLGFPGGKSLGTRLCRGRLA